VNPYVRAAVGVAGLTLALGGAGVLLATSGSADTPGDGGPLGPGVVTVDLGIHHSAFSTDQIVVHEGTTIRFVVHNDDPILHELIVGPPDVHLRHENGTEAAHPPRPGEVTIQPLDRATTTYEFTATGSTEFACHLPGHHAYGMSGQVVVVP
jgi:uncharacterized cupredoxin-like copper-binding protein